MAMVAPMAAAEARQAAGTKLAAKAAAGGGGARKPPTGGGGARKPPAGGGKPGGGGKPTGGGRKRARAALSGESGNYRRWLIAEFIVCVMLLGLSPLAAGRGEVGPRRFMKRGSATCALFIVLGLVSAAGRGAAKAAGMFGALVTLALLIDQRSAFGRLATTLTGTKADEAADAQAAADLLGPDDSTDADDAGSVMT